MLLGKSHHLFDRAEQAYDRAIHLIRTLDQSFQSAFNGLHLFHTSRFQSDGGQCRSNFIRCQIEIDILFQPIIRDIHIIIFLLFPKVTCKGNKIFWLAGNYK